MELSEILTLLERFDASSATSLKLELGELRLELEKGSAPAAPAAGIPAAPTQVLATAPAAEVECVEV